MNSSVDLFSSSIAEVVSQRVRLQTIKNFIGEIQQKKYQPEICRKQNTVNILQNADLFLDFPKALQVIL